MSFKDLDIKYEYRSLIDNMPQEFYIPILKEAVLYKRAVGYFSSSVLVQISQGIAGLIKNGGSIQVITSPNLSDADIHAIREGYANREKIIKEALLKEFKDPQNEYQSDRLNLLANLIADGRMDIRVVVTENNAEIGLYHEKVGIVVDMDGNKIAFTGSMNETGPALTANYETIDVFRSWTDEIQRIKTKEIAFDAIWGNTGAGVKTYVFPEVTDEFIKKYRKSYVNYEKLEKEGKETAAYEHEHTFFSQPADIIYHDYQKDAMEEWMNNQFCGIFDMATGTGKTYTALGSLSLLSGILNDHLAVIIVAPYQHLVEQWIEDINRFNVEPIVAYSYKGQNWRTEFSNAISAYNVNALDHFCVIATNATFSGDDFQNLLKKFKKNFCFVVDEAHNMGAEKSLLLLPRKARYRLALSATIERYRDAKGTEILRQYFGKTCISFSLKEAIQHEFLTPYYYHPIPVYLANDELEEYKDLTQKIVRAGYQEGQEIEKGSLLELLLIKRARIIAGCRGKIDALIKTIEPYKNDSHILVYCGATKYDRADTELSDESDIRQIDEVNYRLYTDLGMKVRKFTSSESKEERTEIKNLFTSEAIQVITAIKCLDEGVNIPSITKAFILASSTNPKEYIQRRGRVLRKADGKEFAEIFDFITLPRPLNEVVYCDSQERKIDLNLIHREFERMEDFASTARNPSDIDKLRQTIFNTYGLL